MNKNSFGTEMYLFVQKKNNVGLDNCGINN